MDKKEMLKYTGTLQQLAYTLSFTAKPGLNGRNPFDTHGQEALRSIIGGLFFTCGLQNICGPCETDGVEYPMHGRIRTTPAEHLCADSYWDGDNYVLEVRGEMRESELFGTNLVLRRTIRSVYGSGRLEIIDRVENQSPEEAQLMLMYHCNFGYPFLRPGTRLVLPSNSSVYGRKFHEARGDLHTIAPFGTEVYRLSFTILRDARDIAATEAERDRLLEK